jgi:hypothetical protein
VVRSPDLLQTTGDVIPVPAELDRANEGKEQETGCLSSLAPRTRISPVDIL